MPEGLQRGSRDTAFSIYLRTGQRVAIPPIELKFNPYHDPRNGRFTFAPGGSVGNAAPYRTTRAKPGKAPPKPAKRGAILLQAAVAAPSEVVARAATDIGSTLKSLPTSSESIPR